eukprot:jgi/Ulvmu1/7002/UM033_0060.1
MAALSLYTRFALGAHCLKTYRWQVQSSRFSGHIRKADASLCSGQGAIDPNKATDGAEGKAAVDKLLDEANAAADSATTALEHMNDPPKGHGMKKAIEITSKIARRGMVSGLLLLTCAHMLFTQGCTISNRLITASAVTVFLAWGGYAKKSLDLTGAIAAMEVGFATIFSSYAMGGILLAFFVTSSLLTRVSSNMKRRIDAEFKEGGQRDWKQVACNGAVPSVLALMYGAVTNFTHIPFLCGADGGAAIAATALQGAVLGYYSCACGDTWASEVGVLAPGKPLLVTSWKPVPKGTNGGVSTLGLAFSAAGGLAMGLTAYLFAICGAPNLQASPAAPWIIALGVLSGLAGSLLDSLLGATLQYSGYDEELKKVMNHPGPRTEKICGTAILTNNQVNLVSTSLTAALCGALSVLLYGGL